MQKPKPAVLKSYASIILVDAVIMAVELAAVRQLAPFFGASYDIWAIIIGLVLLATSLGNWLGGYWKKSPQELFFWFCVSLLMVWPLSSIIISLAAGVPSHRVGAVLTALVLYFSPALLGGMLSPVLLVYALRAAGVEEPRSIEHVSAVFHAMMAVGGIVGTFATGFWLIPLLGSEAIFAASTLACALLCIVWGWTNRWTVSSAVVAIFGAVWLFSPSMLEVSEGVILDKDSQYNHIVVLDHKKDGRQYRSLLLSKAHTSAAFPLDDPTALTFSYLKAAYTLTHEKGDRLKILAIGGGGYTYQKKVLAEMPASTIDTLEIDPEIIKVAGQFFYWDQIREQYDPQGLRHKDFAMDARIWLNDNQGAGYDIIFNDAFNAGIPPMSLTTVEAVKRVKSNLKPDGAYLINLIGSLEGRSSRFVMAEYNTVQQVFKHVCLYPSVTTTPDARNNFILYASDTERCSDVAVDVSVPPGTLILTDAHAPVEAMHF